jgi:hypothetical protein
MTRTSRSRTIRRAVATAVGALAMSLSAPTRAADCGIDAPERQRFLALSTRLANPASYADAVGLEGIDPAAVRLFAAQAVFRDYRALTVRCARTSGPAIDSALDMLVRENEEHYKTSLEHEAAKLTTIRDSLRTGTWCAGDGGSRCVADHPNVVAMRQALRRANVPTDRVVAVDVSGRPREVTIYYDDPSVAPPATPTKGGGEDPPTGAPPSSPK